VEAAKTGASKFSGYSEMGATSESSCWGDAFGATCGAAALFPVAGALAGAGCAAGAGGLVA